VATDAWANLSLFAISCFRGEIRIGEQRPTQSHEIGLSFLHYTSCNIGITEPPNRDYGNPHVRLD
jgi:hypothetical protein